MTRAGSPAASTGAEASLTFCRPQFLSQGQSVQLTRNAERHLESLYREQEARVWRAVFAYTGHHDVLDS